MTGCGPWRRALEPDERALRLRERLGRLLRRDDATNLVIVPRCSRLARRLHLRQKEIMEQAAVLAHPALGKEVVHRQGVHLRRNRETLGGPGGLHRLQIVHDRGICPGLHHAGHPPRPREEALRPGARCLVHVPVEALGEHQAARGLEPEPMDDTDDDYQSREPLAAATVLSRTRRVSVTTCPPLPATRSLT